MKTRSQKLWPPYIERYKIGPMNFLIDANYRVWQGGCRVTDEFFSIDIARKRVFEYAKSVLKSRIAEANATLKGLKLINQELKEPFDVRAFKVKL